MTTLAKKSLKNTPDDKRTFSNGSVAFSSIGGVAFALAVSEPGWKWSEHIKPTAGTDWCEVPHTLYEISGTMHVKMNDGSEIDIMPGDVAHVPSGHDAWVVGDEPAVAINVTQEMADKFAK